MLPGGVRRERELALAAVHLHTKKLKILHLKFAVFRIRILFRLRDLRSKLAVYS
jgi:hypothetical protein